jgi:hypothetical protein
VQRFPAWGRVAGTAGEDILISAVEVFQRLLQCVDRRRFQPIDLGRQRRDRAALAGIVERPAGPSPFLSLLKREVVYEPTRACGVRHLLRLGWRGVEPVGVGLAFDHRCRVTSVYEAIK